MAMGEIDAVRVIKQLHYPFFYVYITSSVIPITIGDWEVKFRKH
jgi:hypothetical protein